MKFQALVVSSILALGSSAALADNFYVLGSVGQSKIKDWRASGTAGLTTDDTDTAFKLQLGYNLNKNFAVEGGYFNLGKATANYVSGGTVANASAKADGWNISAVGKLPINDSFAVFGKLGAFYSDTKVSASASIPGIGSGAVNASDSKTGMVYGLGLSYDMTKAIALRAEYEIYDKVGGTYLGTDLKSKVDVFSVGVAYKF